MNLNLATLLAAGLFASAPAFAADVVVDFDEPTSFASIGDFYADSLGVSFGLDILALQNDELGPYYSNSPSPTGVMTVVGADATMNFATGFTAASFWYSTTSFAIVNIYSGLDGTGDLLAAFALVDNATYGCSDSAYCNWNFASNAFNGVAHSITFANAEGAGFDNLTITAVPEPSQALLLSLGLAGVAYGARRMSRKQA
ncbi:PEP-CTERM sorting domain-containing protein [Methyloversatilis thermotolerans]|uniref:PEP-CTERM sorting domain-containing protein n=1 Tax=Methyloversatilis thermotolerans TaxID=1346290 RepID=UPI00037ADBB3|nr:PEP-CTERM sorting domain-containing protein [Methyloversatilis thermotolerans]